LLAQYFLERYAKKNRKSAKGFAPMAMDMLLKYPWPGNVRELENAIERAVVLMTGDHITENQLPLSVVQSYPDQEASTISRPMATDGNRSLEEIEKEAILATLNATGGNKSETARRLGITRKTLHNKLKSYGV
jgi:two-component system response regulator HydG